MKISLTKPPRRAQDAPRFLANPLPSPDRRHDIDVLRVGAVLFGLLYHATRAFDSEAWHIKNAEVSGALELLGLAMTPWRMPLLFVLAGAGAYFALGFRSSGQYAWERLRRLVLPLVAGMLLIIPPQIYVERISVGMANRLSPHNLTGTYLEFYPRVFTTGPYPAGDLSWHHLWFLAYLFVFSMLALPLFAALRSPRAVDLVDRIAGWFEKPGRIFLPALPLIAIELLLRHRSSGSQTLVGDWVNLAHYGLLFVYGYLMMASPRFGQAIVAQRRDALALGVGLAVQRLIWLAFGQPGAGGVLEVMLTIVRANCEWAGILAVLGYARVSLNRPYRWLPWASEVSYPFYIFHQTVIVVLAYHVVKGEAAIFWKFGTLLAVSLPVTLALCELVRRSGPLRPLFGLKAAPSASGRLVRPAALAPLGAGADRQP